MAQQSGGKKAERIAESTKHTLCPIEKEKRETHLIPAYCYQHQMRHEDLSKDQQGPVSNRQ